MCHTGFNHYVMHLKALQILLCHIEDTYDHNLVSECVLCLPAGSSSACVLATLIWNGFPLHASHIGFGLPIQIVSTISQGRVSMFLASEISLLCQWSKMMRLTWRFQGSLGRGWRIALCMLTLYLSPKLLIHVNQLFDVDDLQASFLMASCLKGLSWSSLVIVPMRDICFFLDVFGWAASSIGEILLES